MKKLLENKYAIVTGARRGMGRAIVERFAENGSNVWAWARKPDSEFETDMAALAEKHNVRISPVYADLSDEAAIKEAVKIIGKEKLPIDILVNNAGITFNALFQMTSMEKLREQFQVNYFSQFLLMQLVVRFMSRSGGGSVINTASSAAIDANSGRSAYGSAKAALICTTKAAAEELGAQNIRVNAIAPGITDTAMVGESMSEKVIEDTISDTMLGKMGKPENIADVALFLASDLSSYITGQVLRVDGGMK